MQSFQLGKEEERMLFHSIQIQVKVKNTCESF